MFKKSTALIIVLILFIFACGNSPTFPTDQSLVGSWHWYLSIGGNLGQQTPEMCNCEYWYTFYTDGTFEYHFDDELIQSGEYEVRQEFSEFFNRTVNNLYLNEIVTPFDYNGDILIFLNPRLCLSCPDSVYFSRDPRVFDE